MPGSFIWRDRATARWLSGIARVRFFILPSARLHREANRDAITGADFSAVRFVFACALVVRVKLRIGSQAVAARAYCCSAAIDATANLPSALCRASAVVCPPNARRHSRSCRMAWSRHRAQRCSYRLIQARRRTALLYVAEESAFIPDITAQAASRARCTSICAAAMRVARANAVGSASGPASASANSVTCWWNAGSAIAGTPKACRRALREERALPSGVFGPLLLLPFRRLASR